MADQPNSTALRLNVGDRCPGCHVICAHLDIEHRDDCSYVGKIDLVSSPQFDVYRERFDLWPETGRFETEPKR